METRKSGFGRVLIFGLIIFIFYIFLFLIYKFWIREEIARIYVGQGSGLFQSLIDWIYPRFTTEKARLPLDFFMRKADQIIFRLGLILLFGLGFIFLSTFKPSLRARWTSFWEQKMSVKQSRILHILLGLNVLYITRDWLEDLFAYSSLTGFFYPSFIIRVLGWGYPSPEILGLAYGCMLCALWLSYWQEYPETYLVVFALIFVLLQAYLFSFHKLDHTYAPLNSIIFGFPILLYYARQATANQLLTMPAWPLLWMRCMVAACYFLAGVEKILVGGLAWFYPQNLAAYLGQHPSSWGLWIAREPILSTTISILVVLFEISFVAILWFPRFAAGFLFAGCLFHWGIYGVMGIGGWLHYWILSYFIFISWDKIIRPKTRLGCEAGKPRIE